MRGKPVVMTLLLTDLVGSTRFVEVLGDVLAAETLARHDRIARDLLARCGGQEIDKTDGFLFIFDRPIDAVRYAVSYHDELRELGESLGVEMSARAGVHLGEVVLWENSAEDVARGAKPVELEGLAKPMAARIMSLAQGGQTLLTQSAYELAQRASLGARDLPGDLQWVRHDFYALKGIEDPIRIYEVGRQGLAPLSPPPDSEKARRAQPGGGNTGLLWAAVLGAFMLIVLSVLLLGAIVAVTFWPNQWGVGESHEAPDAPLFAKLVEGDGGESPVEGDEAEPQAGVEGGAVEARVEPDVGVAAQGEGDEAAAEPDGGAQVEGDAGGGEDEPSAGVVRVRIVTEPPGARIRVNNKRVEGTSPLTVELPAVEGRYRVKAALKGYKLASRRCVLSSQERAAGEATCTLRLRKRRGGSPEPAGGAYEPIEEKPRIHMVD